MKTKTHPRKHYPETADGLTTFAAFLCQEARNARAAMTMQNTPDEDEHILDAAKLVISDLTFTLAALKSMAANNAKG